VFGGDDPSKWKSGLRTFDTLVYSNLYDGIDLRFYGDTGALKYEFVVAKGADHRQIRMAYSGADTVAITLSGELSIVLGTLRVPEAAPVVYQNKDKKRIDLVSQYERTGSGEICFEVLDADPQYPFVIDPEYSTLFGGRGAEGINNLCIVSDSLLLMAVTSTSDDLLSIGGVYADYSGTMDAYIIAMNPITMSVLHTTYYGGKGKDYSWHISSYNKTIILVGGTTSSDLPTTQGAFQNRINGEENCFVAVFSENCDRLIASTLLGGTGIDYVEDAITDADGNIWLTGWSTSSMSFPRTKNAAQSNYRGGEDDAFVAAISSDCTKLLYGSFLGGNGYDEARGIAVDWTGRVVVCGYTSSDNFPVTGGALQSGRKGFEGGFISAIDTASGNVTYSTYFGGSYQDFFEKIAVTDNGVVLLGETCSMNVPVTPGSFQTKRGNQDSAIFSWDNFIVRLDSNFRMKWCSYLGGAGEEDATAIMYQNGNVFASGYTTSKNFPLCNPLLAYQKAEDMTLTVIDGDGRNILFSTYWGGNDYDLSTSIAVHNRSVYLAGATASTNYPLTSNALKTNRTGNNDATLTVFSLDEMGLTAAEAPGAVPTMLSIVHNYPNPFQGSTEVVFALGAPGNVLLRVCDAQGRLVESRNLSRLEAGRHGYTLRTTDWAPGVYYCTISAGGSTATRKLVKLAR
jgi:hypothetical protein